MARERIMPTCEELRQFLEQGMSTQEIAELWGELKGREISPRAIGSVKSRCGLTKPQVRLRRAVPWRLDADHEGHVPIALRTLEILQNGGKVTEHRRKRLGALLRNRLGAKVDENWNLVSTERVIMYAPRHPHADHGFLTVDASTIPEKFLGENMPVVVPVLDAEPQRYASKK